MKKHSEYFSYLHSLDGKSEVISDETCCSQKKNHVINNGTIVCDGCGMMINNINSEPEWKNYNSDGAKNKNSTRCGMPVNSLLPLSSVGSYVSNSHIKGMHKISIMQGWNGMPYKERSRYKVMLLIKTKCNNSNLPEIIINEACSLYTIVSGTKISRGVNRNGIIAACVYFACKELNVPRSSKEIASVFSIESTVMTKGCKKCQEIINLNKTHKNRLLSTKSIQPDDFIDRFCNKLKIEETMRYKINKLCEKVIRLNIISPATPPSIASGCIYYICKLEKISITKKDISETCKISEVTINKCMKKIDVYDKKEKSAIIIQRYYKTRIKLVVS